MLGDKVQITTLALALSWPPMVPPMHAVRQAVSAQFPLQRV